VKLLEQLKPWTDEYGLIHSAHPMQWGGNGLSYTALAYVIANLRGEEPPVERYIQALLYCRDPYWRLRRRPGNDDQNAWDDYASTGAALVVLGLWGHGESAYHGLRQLWWFVNNERPGTFRYRDGRWNLVSPWIGRMPQVRFVFTLAARREPSWVLQNLWCIGIHRAVEAPGADQGAHRMAYLQVMAYLLSGFRSEQCSKAAHEYIKSVERRFKNFRHTQHGYFPPDHPLLTNDWPTQPLLPAPHLSVVGELTPPRTQAF
jgi:hypothetical protein